MENSQDFGLISYLLETLEMSAVLSFLVGKRKHGAVFTCIVKKPDAFIALAGGKTDIFTHTEPVRRAT